MDTYYVNKEFLCEDEAAISVKDISVLRGYGVFDFLRSYNGHPFHLARHIERLAKSARLIDLALPESEEDIFDLTMECIKRNNHSDFNVRIVVTGGISSSNYLPEKGNANLLIMVTALSAMPEEYYSQGAKVITSNTERFVPGAKSINYVPSIMAMKEAANQDALEALLVDRNGYIQEGTTSNFFAVINGRLTTPPGDRILPGVTREVILNLLENKIEVDVRPIHIEEIRTFDEAFITASNKEIIPVHTINSVKMPETIGSITAEVTDIFANYTKAYQG